MKRRRFWITALVTLLMTWMMSCSTVLSSDRALSDSHFARLTHGVNVAHWFAQAPLTADNFQTRITEDDLRLIKEIGFRHVRLPVDPEILFNDDEPASLNSENLNYLDAALDKILAQDLAVIVDLHPQGSFKRRLLDEPEFPEALGQFWQALAHHLSDRDPDSVFLEVMNEPATEDPQDWYTLQEPLLAAMRAGAPNHTLIASANLRAAENDWDTIKALTLITPVDDPNVVYNFHFYYPMPFTHQGADWGDERWQHLHNVPYPSDPATIAPLLSTIDNEAARDRLRHYGEERWNRDKIESRIRQAADWGRSHQVRVTCNEFGVFRHVASPGDRGRWLRDVRTILESHDIGWSIWEYNAGFGVVREEDDRAVPDTTVVQALFGSSRTSPS